VNLLNNKNIALFLIKLTISLSLIVFLIKKIDIPYLINLLSVMDLKYIYLFVIIYFLIIIISSYRWKYLLDIQDIEIPIRKVIGFYLVGTFFNILTPSTIGGDAVRIFDLSKYSRKPLSSFSSVFIDRWAGLGATFLIALFSLVLSGEFCYNSSITLLISITSIIFLVFSISLFSQKSKLTVNWLFKKVGNLRQLDSLKRLIDKFFTSIHIYKDDKAVLINVFNFSIAIKFLSILTTYIIAQSIALNISFWYFLIYVPMIIIITTIPISIAGIGIREGAFIYFFSKVGVSDSDSFALSLLVFLSWFFISIIPGSLIYILRK